MNGMSPVFVTHAADILSDGLTGSEIVRTTAGFAVQYKVDLPHPRYPFQASNKRTALSDNLLAFADSQRYRIIKELCDHKLVLERNREAARKLKIQLMTQYGHLDEQGGSSELDESLIDQTRHWLDPFPEVLDLYNQALLKHEHGPFVRNVLDDLRLALEKLLQELFNNSKSLENQISSLGQFIKARGGSTELSNMFVKLLDYYAKYQNSYVKHDDAVIEEEVEFVFEITSSFMKHLVRLAGRDAV